MYSNLFLLPRKQIERTVIALGFHDLLCQLKFKKMFKNTDIFNRIYNTFKYCIKQNRHFASSSFIHPCFGLISTAIVSNWIVFEIGITCWWCDELFLLSIRPAYASWANNASGRKATSGQRTPVEQHTSLSSRCTESGHKEIGLIWFVSKKNRVWNIRDAFCVAPNHEIRYTCLMLGHGV